MLGQNTGYLETIVHIILGLSIALFNPSTSQKALRLFFLLEFDKHLHCLVPSDV